MDALTDTQKETLDKIIANLAEDGRFKGSAWCKHGKCRVYVEDYGYIAIGKDGTAYPSLRRYRGNISSAAGL